MALARRNAAAQPVNDLSLVNTGDYGNVFSEFDRLFNDLSSGILSTSRTSYPVDLYETGDAVVLEMAVPGLKADDLDISLEGRELTIRGHYESTPAEHEDRRYWLKNRPEGEFRRSVTLPVRIEADNVEANVRDGLLTLRMPKVAEAQARKINIQAS